MNNSFPRLIDGMCATLRTEVLSRLDDEFARGQVFGIINLLNTFKLRADWSTDFLSQQVSVQCHALEQVRSLIVSLPHTPDMATLTVPRVVSPAELLALRDTANLEISKLLDWFASAKESLPEATALAIESQLRQSMRREIEIELKNSPRPLFAEMSSGQETPN
jgi:hypothetical protein